MNFETIDELSVYLMRESIVVKNESGGFQLNTTDQKILASIAANFKNLILANPNKNMESSFPMLGFSRTEEVEGKTIYSVLPQYSELVKDIVLTHAKVFPNSVVSPDFPIRIKGENMRKMAKKGARSLVQQNGIYSVSLCDGGDNNNFHHRVAGYSLARKTNPVEFKPSAAHLFPDKTEMESLRIIGNEQVIPENYSFLRAQGRTLLFSNPNGEDIIALKFLKKKEKPIELSWEHQMMEFLAKNCEGLFNFEPLFVSEKRVLKVEKHVLQQWLEKNGEEKISFAQSLSEQGLIGDFETDDTEDSFTCFAYRTKSMTFVDEKLGNVASTDYFEYLEDQNIRDELFESGTIRNLWILGQMLSYGIAHSSLTPLDHAADRNYNWAIDLFPEQQGPRSGAGRLNSALSVKYSNFRISGPVDWAEGKKASNEPKQLLQQLGHYYLSWVTVLVRAGLNHKNITSTYTDDTSTEERMAYLLETGLRALCNGYVGHSPTSRDIDLSCDFRAIAKELIFFSTDDYVQAILEKKLPDFIYDKETKVVFPSFPIDKKYEKLKKLSKNLSPGWTVMKILPDSDEPPKKIHIGWALSLAEYGSKESLEKLLGFKVGLHNFSCLKVAERHTKRVRGGIVFTFFESSLKKSHPNKTLEETTQAIKEKFCEYRDWGPMNGPFSNQKLISAMYLNLSGLLS